MASKKKLLIYAHYYYPDVASTGQILTELAEGLSGDYQVTVICTVPSYTGSIEERYKKQKFYRENINGIDVLRIRVPEFDKNKPLSRIRNILSYFFSAIKATSLVGDQDYIYAISQPPILGGVLGIIGKKAKKAKLIYNIQDFNPEQMIAVSFVKTWIARKIMMRVDKHSCRKSDKIVVVGRDMVETLKRRFGNNVPSYTYINNWINEKEIIPLDEDDKRVQQFKKEHGLDNKFVIMYSGNIGLYYDLLELERVIASFKDQKDVVFAFVGQGSVLTDMEKYKQDNDLDNIVFIPYQAKEDLVYSLNAADVHFVVNAKGIKGVSVPSKIYGVMAAAKPVLGILEEATEARMIIEESGCGRVVNPGDYKAITETIQYYIDNKNSQELADMGNEGRRYLEAHLTKDTSLEKYAEVLSAL